MDASAHMRSMQIQGLKAEARQAGLVKAMLVPVVAQKAPQAVQVNLTLANCFTARCFVCISM